MSNNFPSVVCELCGASIAVNECTFLPKHGPIPLCPKCATPERIAAYRKKRNATTRHESQKSYAAKPKSLKPRRAAQLQYAQTEKGRKARAEAQARYRKTAKGQAAYARVLDRRHEAQEKAIHDVSTQ